MKELKGEEMNQNRMFPKAEAFLKKTGMTLDEALIWSELELKKEGKQ